MNSGFGIQQDFMAFNQISYPYLSWWQTRHSLNSRRGTYFLNDPLVLSRIIFIPGWSWLNFTLKTWLKNISISIAQTES